ncbi:hypothetical protein F4782DRAFT_515865 [Xylaria castorea]|nr:hypothetical protein F4782DRAFT_515865 [Xylaria castorea]
MSRGFSSRFLPTSLSIHQILLGTKNTCIFAAKPLDANDGPAVITWNDAADVIQGAVVKFLANSQLRGSGVMDRQVTIKDNARVLSWKGNWKKNL